MWFNTKKEAVYWKHSEEMLIPVLRGKLSIVRDTVTQWCRKTGDPYKIKVYTVVIKQLRQGLANQRESL